MKNRKCIIALLCGVILLGGCGSEKPKQDEQAALTPIQETAEENVISEPATEGENKAQASGSSDAGGSLVLEMGPDKALWREGSMVFTLHDLMLYESPEEAGIDVAAMYTIDAENYADRSKFLLMQIDVNNIDYKGDYEDGSINLSLFTIMPRNGETYADWYCSLPVYLSEPGEDTDFYHVLIEKGQTKTVTLGFYVPVSDAGELCTQCIISIGGSDDEGYHFEIPEVQ